MSAGKPSGFCWWLTPLHHPARLMLPCDNFSVDVSFLNQASLAYVSGTSKAGTQDSKSVLGCWGSCVLRNRSVTRCAR